MYFVCVYISYGLTRRPRLGLTLTHWRPPRPEHKKEKRVSSDPRSTFLHLSDPGRAIDPGWSRSRDDGGLELGLLIRAVLFSFQPGLLGLTRRWRPPRPEHKKGWTFFINKLLHRSTKIEVDALGVITISRGCFERCGSNKKTPP